MRTYSTLVKIEACQGRGRGFESLRPLQFFLANNDLDNIFLEAQKGGPSGKHGGSAHARVTILKNRNNGSGSFAGPRYRAAERFPPGKFGGATSAWRGRVPLAGPLLGGAHKAQSSLAQKAGAFLDRGAR